MWLENNRVEGNFQQSLNVFIFTQTIMKGYISAWHKFSEGKSDN